MSALSRRSFRLAIHPMAHSNPNKVLTLQILPLSRPTCLRKTPYSLCQKKNYHIWQGPAELPGLKVMENERRQYPLYLAQISLQMTYWNFL